MCPPACAGVCIRYASVRARYLPKCVFNVCLFVSNMSTASSPVHILCATRRVLQCVRALGHSHNLPQRVLFYSAGIQHLLPCVLVYLRYLLSVYLHVLLISCSFGLLCFRRDCFVNTSAISVCTEMHSFGNKSIPLWLFVRRRT